MWAVVIALAVMMWVWAAAGLHLSAVLERGGVYPVRMAWLVAILAMGATVLMVLLWLVLPSSVLSQGWSLQQLQATQQLTVLCIVLVTALAIWRAHVLLRPAPVKNAAAPAMSAVKKLAAVKAAQKKRRQ